MNWTWYEWLGVIAPLAILWQVSKIDFRNSRPALGRISRTLVWFGMLATAAGILVSINQPTTGKLHPAATHAGFPPIYVVFFLILGELIGGRVLRKSTCRTSTDSAPSRNAACWRTT